MNLTSVSEGEDIRDIKVIDLSMPTIQWESSLILPLRDSSPIDSSSLSTELVDTDVLSSIESNFSKQV